ncbi:hypothetical protein [Noviluteimonas gilva]|uniref:Secreted protein n=1 Tax=Noviluteimonas gilva TaxID=2682097 RepID=A0A7C9HLN5_9GAMM|nr:hypothetical protein [Lysobacter gilvus]MUV13875.1 hypothetical protein [Lysobacter gilvus]
MNLARTLLIATCLVLAACAAPAAQDASQQQPPAAASTASPPPVSMPRRTGGPLPPQRMVDNTCTVDADCSAKPQCIGTQCRCVQDKCLAKRDAVDPVIDPAPASSVR